MLDLIKSDGQTTFKYPNKTQATYTSVAESYADIAGENTSIDVEIDKALDAGSAEIKASDSLAALKSKLGMGEGDA